MSIGPQFSPNTPLQNLAVHPEGWVLALRPDKGSPPWQSYRLFRVKYPQGSRKNSFWLSWNGASFARASDPKILHEHYPELEQWVKARLREHHGASRPSPLTGPTKVLATVNGWHLVELLGTGRGGWRNMLLSAPELLEREYLFGWSGVRLSYGADVQALRVDHPELEAWVRDILELL